MDKIREILSDREIVPIGAQVSAGASDADVVVCVRYLVQFAADAQRSAHEGGETAIRLRRRIRDREAEIAGLEARLSHVTMWGERRENQLVDALKKLEAARAALEGQSDE